MTGIWWQSLLLCWQERTTVFVACLDWWKMWETCWVHFGSDLPGPWCTHWRSGSGCWSLDAGCWSLGLICPRLFLHYNYDPVTVLLAGKASTNSRDEGDGQRHLPALNSGLEDSVLLFVWTQSCFLPASAGTAVEWCQVSTLLSHPLQLGISMAQNGWVGHVHSLWGTTHFEASFWRRIFICSEFLKLLMFQSKGQASHLFLSYTVVGLWLWNMKQPWPQPFSLSISLDIELLMFYC